MDDFGNVSSPEKLAKPIGESAKPIRYGQRSIALNGRKRPATIAISMVKMSSLLPSSGKDDREKDADGLVFGSSTSARTPGDTTGRSKISRRTVMEAILS